MVARAQQAKSYRLNGADGGSQISSGGMLGTPSQGYCPNIASQIRVKTRACATPPRSWITCSARRIGSLVGSRPRTLSAA